MGSIAKVIGTDFPEALGRGRSVERIPVEIKGSTALILGARMAVIAFVP